MLKPFNQNAKYCYERVFECSRLQQVGAVPNSRIYRFCSGIEKCSRLTKSRNRISLALRCQELLGFVETRTARARRRHMGIKCAGVA